uniref:Uncharacterized protein n=1 Tax=Candidatus Kentrum sp. LPFa TaxID=2126335 RepID=A0A450Y040_9GAMM|nr:MAG: hypothetical protein BECKLPF1236A_GA0070988_103073 [Candidatus Kentron sp. LPFa]VFK34900.1 MAG: hypothetical protein BECKLPF1236C_GA0070990_103103 [Candidatus Kentron sp. LPFa]
MGLFEDIWRSQSPMKQIPFTQPGKSGTKKVDERYHFMSFSNFLIILFRIFRESD